MNLSSTGANFIKQWEGLRLVPYDDGYGNATIGYGHLIRPGERFGKITQAQADQLFYDDAAARVQLVNSLVSVPLTQSQFDASVSLAFNWKDFPSSQYLQLLNSGQYQAAADRLGAWPVTSGGVYSQGLANRRAAERALFLSEGSPVSAENPVILEDALPEDAAFASAGIGNAGILLLVLGLAFVLTSE